MSEEKTHIGYVLWFDQRKGYGFVRIIDSNSDFNNKEIFVHYSCIHTGTNYKKLFPGEYVSMDVKHQPEVAGKELICLNLTGVNGGKLLVENEDYNYKIYNKRNFNGNYVNDGNDGNDGNDVNDGNDGNDGNDVPETQ